MANKYLDYDGLVEVASKLKETIDGKQDALNFYSEDVSTATLTANMVNIDAGTGGINLTHGAVSFSVINKNDKNGVYYNDAEVATVDDIDNLSSSFETIVAGKQDALRWYSEDAGASITLTSKSNIGEGISFSTSVANQPINISTLSSSSGISLSTSSGGANIDLSVTGANINFNTVGSNSKTYYNSTEIGTVNTNHMWICPSKLTPNTVSNLYPQIGSPSAGDFILWITLNSGNVNINPLQITTVGSDGVVSYTDLRSTWANL